MSLREEEKCLKTNKGGFNWVPGPCKNSRYSAGSGCGKYWLMAFLALVTCRCHKCTVTNLCHDLPQWVQHSSGSLGNPGQATSFLWGSVSIHFHQSWKILILFKGPADCLSATLWIVVISVLGSFDLDSAQGQGIVKEQNRYRWTCAH